MVWGQLSISHLSLSLVASQRNSYTPSRLLRHTHYGALPLPSEHMAVAHARARMPGVVALAGQARGHLVARSAHVPCLALPCSTLPHTRLPHLHANRLHTPPFSCRASLLPTPLYACTTPSSPPRPHMLSPPPTSHGHSTDHQCSPLPTSFVAPVDITLSPFPSLLPSHVMFFSPSHSFPTYLLPETFYSAYQFILPLHAADRTVTCAFAFVAFGSEPGEGRLGDRQGQADTPVENRQCLPFSFLFLSPFLPALPCLAIYPLHFSCIFLSLFKTGCSGLCTASYLSISSTSTACLGFSSHSQGHPSSSTCCSAFWVPSVLHGCHYSWLQLIQPLLSLNLLLFSAGVALHCVDLL